MTTILTRNGRFLTRWIIGFLGFPLGGLLAVTVAGSIDGVTSAAVGGGLAGAVIGLAQWLALRGWVAVGPRWVAATAIGLAVGNAVGTALNGAGTGGGDLVALGLTAGLAVGLAQGAMLRRAQGSTILTLAWPAVVAVAWPIGWTVTWAAGVDVERGYAVFGATGALTFSVLTGAALLALTRRQSSVSDDRRSGPVGIVTR